MNNDNIPPEENAEDEDNLNYLPADHVLLFMIPVLIHIFIFIFE
jgi:hypothetical protein